MTQQTIVDSSLQKVCAIALVLGLAAGCKSKSSDETTPGCQPEGGIQCNTNVLSICKGGDLTVAGPCPGGCETRGREARCFDPSKSLIAPIGTACQKGMALCGMTPNTLLVCQDGGLTSAGECPGGCIDRGDGSMLYCVDKQNNLRFAVGMGCSGLGKPFERACGMDGKTVLICRENYYEKYASNCHQCSQQHNGELVCVNSLMDRVDVTPDAAASTAP